MLYQALAEGLSAREAATRIARSPDAIRAKAKWYGLTFLHTPGKRMVKGKFREWSVHEDNQLRSLLERKAVREVARTLGRSYKAVLNRAHRLGVPTAGNTVTIKEVADLLGLHWPTVGKHVRKLGIKKRKQTAFSRYYKNRKGLTEEEVQAIAKSILEDPLAGMKSLKKIRAVANGDFIVEGMSERMRRRRKPKKYVQL